MATFPLRCMYRVLANLAELEAALREDAPLGPRRRQDEHAAEVWLEAMEEDPEIARAVEEAAVDMLATEADPCVLDLILILGAHGGEPFHAAAARRVLEGPPIQDAGRSGGYAAANLRMRAGGVAEPTLRARLYAASQPLDRLRMSLDERSLRLVDDFRAAIDSGGLNASLVGRLALVASLLGPACLEAAALAARALPAEARAAFLAEALENSPERRSILEAMLGP